MADELELFASAADGLCIEHFGMAEDGRPFVVAGVFAKTMDYRDAANALRILDEDEKGTQIVSTPGGDQRVSVIYEDGIWELIFRSTKPSAKAIKKRVKAILRQLRETGVVDTREKPMTELEMARGYVAALERIAELEPAAHSWETLSDAAGDYAVREAAQILDRDPSIKTGEKRLFQYLRDIPWIDSRNQPYQRHVECGRLVVRTRPYKDGLTGAEQVGTQLRVTPKGLHELHRLLGGSGPVLLEVSA